MSMRRQKVSIQQQFIHELKVRGVVLHQNVPITNYHDGQYINRASDIITMNNIREIANNVAKRFANAVVWSYNDKTSEMTYGVWNK